MIDEDVRLQIDHQISGLLYLMLWCNQSLSSPPCPPHDGVDLLSLNVRPNEVQANTELKKCAITELRHYIPAFHLNLNSFPLNALMEDSL